MRSRTSSGNEKCEILLLPYTEHPRSLTIARERKTT